MKPSLFAISLFVTLIAAVPTMQAKHRRPAPTGQTNSTGFVNQINNAFFPLAPGTTFLYQGTKDGVPTSDAFTAGHRQGSVQGELAEHPVVSLYEVVLEQGNLTPAALHLRGEGQERRAKPVRFVPLPLSAKAEMGLGGEASALTRNFFASAVS